ncbi:helix-turn-helix domain-containing protein [Streptomyces sp. PmtG]
MLRAGARPRLERNDRPGQRTPRDPVPGRFAGPRFLTGLDVSLFAEPYGYAVTRHRHPAWKAVLPLSGGVRVGAAVGAGVLVPPQYAHTCAAPAGYVAVFLEPWCLRADPSGPTWLEERAVARLLDVWRARPDADELRRETAAVAGAPAAVDPRAVHAVRASGRARRLADVAADVGLSPVRLRALVRAEIGVPLAVARRWRRLRIAVDALLTGEAALADAAVAAGFADQAHLTRTVRALAGRTPGSLRRR